MSRLVPGARTPGHHTPTPSPSSKFGHLSRADQVELEVIMAEAQSKSDDPAEAARGHVALAAWKRFQEEHPQMPTMTERYRGIADKFSGEHAAARAAIAAFREEEGKYPAAWFRQELNRLKFAANEIEGRARMAAGDLFDDAEAEAAKLRLKAEAQRDPAARTADELEFQRLVAGPVDGDAFAERAVAMLKAGEPQRARLLADVAQAKGVRPYVVDSIVRDIEEQLDVTDPTRAQAAAIEAELKANSKDFTQLTLAAADEGSAARREAVEAAMAGVTSFSASAGPVPEPEGGAS
jgi:hypothetical protein